jgi:carbamoyl-phosphate synthase large subunit
LKGIIVQFGGQTPLKLAQFLTENKVPILGTSPDKIDLAEDRDRFQKLLQDLDMLQPRNGIARSADEARTIVKEIGYPVVIRPSYVLGGRAMEIVRTDAGFERYINEAVVVSGDTPVLIDSYLSGAIEVDVDCLCDGESVKVCGIMEHIEEAGIHSGDSACSLPTHSLPQNIIDELIVQSKKMALALEVSGLMNMQYAIKDGEIFVLEVNPRASRTVPFVAKTIGSPVAKIASRIMAGEKLDNAIAKYGEWREAQNLKHMAVKEAVFPFARFPGVDILLGPEMRSTGEVMGLDADYPMAYAKAVLGAGTVLPTQGNIFISVKDSDKEGILPAAKTFVELGFNLMATGGTQRFFEENGLACTRINKVLEGRPHIEDAIHNGQVQMVVNTTEGAKAMSDSRSLRQAALKTRTAHTTTLTAAIAMSEAMEALSKRDMGVKPLQEYLA